jgi:hypothetical protein
LPIFLSLDNLPLPPLSIHLESLVVTESIELLIYLGCSPGIGNRAKARYLLIDGGYLQYLQDVETLQDLEGINDSLRVPIQKGILNKLKKFQEHGIPIDVLNEVRKRIEEAERIKQAEEKRIRIADERKKAEQEAILMKKNSRRREADT